MPVYHFTSTLALPWIVKSGVLQLSVLADADGSADYLWATTDLNGECTAAGLHFLSEEYELVEQGRAKAIRFTLPDTGFVPYLELKKKPADHHWMTQGDIVRLGASKWRCRPDPLPFASALRVDILWGYARDRIEVSSDAWDRIEVTPEHCFDISDDPPTMGIIIDGFHFYSMATGGGYHVPDREELAEMWDDREWSED